jgi:cytochrome c oxidase subunit I
VPAPGPRTRARLTHLWETPEDLRGWLGTVDHKKLGKRYLMTAFAFLLVGGIEAVLIRLQLARADQTLFTAEQYNQIFTLHGVTMIFWYAQPILTGFGVYLIPLMIGARDLAYPRLNAFGYWTFLLSGLFLYASPFLGQSPHAGWFAYVPYSTGKFSPGLGLDFYALSLIFLTISTTSGAVNFIVTILRHRAPGMAISKMPLFMYSSLTVSVSVIFSLPPLTAACTFLLLDRQWSFRFYDTLYGGSTVLWQHLFWFFGHPWVYIIFLPATGMISMLLPVFARRPIVGYPWVAAATVLTGVVGFAVWVHHMFAVGITHLGMSFFSAASMTISVFTAVQVFSWVATLWKGRLVLTSSMLFALGFLALLVVGGLNGIVTAVIPVDWQLHDTHFVVAHLHYVLVGANVFPVFAGFYFWLPKVTGRLMNERLGKLSFWAMFIGFNLTFFPMHILGALGMPRRIFTYSQSQGWETLNLVASVGAGVLTLGVLLSVINFLWSVKKGARAGENPWNADGLEWSASSPPEPYGSVHLPAVQTRYPLWDDHDEEHDPRHERILDGGRYTFTTSALDARPWAIAEMPAASLAPVVGALVLTAVFAGLLAKNLWVAGGALLLALATNAYWAWPKVRKVPEPPLEPEHHEEDKRNPLVTELDPGRGKWGMGCLIATEAMLFVALFFAYFYLGPFPTEKAPKLHLVLPMLGVLLLSSGVLHYGERQVKKHADRRARAALAVTLLLGLVFVALQVVEFRNKLQELTPQMNAYGSIIYTITSFHAAHLLVGLLMLGFVLVLPRLHAAEKPPHHPYKSAALYWHFVDVVWVFIVTFLYILPNLHK